MTTITKDQFGDELKLHDVSEVPESWRSPQLVGIKSVLPLSIVFSSMTKDTQRRSICNKETGFTTVTSRKNKECQYCGTTEKERGALCRKCYLNLRKVSVVLKCSLCGEEFEKKLYEYRKCLKKGFKDVYCSRTCSNAHHAIKNAKNCEICGAPMPGKRHNKYCSPECRKVSLDQMKENGFLKCRGKVVRYLKPITCAECGVDFQPISHLTTYCSRECADIAHAKRMRGAGNSNYKDGTNIIYTRLFDEMRPMIFERDNHSCAVCGFTQNLLVHHINEIKTVDEPTNLITLCKPCHATHHGSAKTPYPQLQSIAESRTKSMTSKWKEQITFLQTRYSYITV